MPFSLSRSVRYFDGNTAGFASFDYEEAGYQEADVVKMEILINAKPVDALSVMCHRSRAETLGRKMCHNLAEVIDRQNFEIIIQARLCKKFCGARAFGTISQRCADQEWQNSGWG